MTTPTGRVLLDRAMTEKEWQAQLVEAARWCGWALVYHTLDSRGSAPGFPDLVLVRTCPPRLLVVECKSQRGRLSAAQIAWLDALRDCGVDVRCWRPSDWPQAVAALREVP